MDGGLLLAYGMIFLSAVSPIYAASYAALRTPKASRRTRTVLADSDEEGSDAEDECQPMVETLNSQDAWLLPIAGSVVLGSLYLAFKFLDRVWINRLLGGYFTMAGVVAVAKTGSVMVHAGLKRAGVKSWTRYKILVTQKSREVLRARVDHIDLTWGVAALAICTFYALTQNWMACNVIALSFAYNAIQLLALDSFRTGIIVLMSLLVYDITWVFGGDVMVTVAKSFEAPIKVVFPKNFGALALYQLHGLHSLSSVRDVKGLLSYLEHRVSSSPKAQMTMLGLGDIVIPGIFISLALSFDLRMAARKNPGSRLTRSSPRGQWERPYFRATMIAYVVGLSTTIGVMHVFKAAQPALLYLSPACSLAVLITASARNEVKDLWDFVADEEAPEKEKGAGDKGAEAQTTPTANGGSHTRAESEVEVKAEADTGDKKSHKKSKKK